MKNLDAKRALEEFLFADPLSQMGLLKVENIWINGRLAAVEQLMRAYIILQGARVEWWINTAY